MELENNVAIVTGASRGIGRAIATKLGEKGASVVLAARTQHELESAAKEIYQLGGKSKVVKTDLRNTKDINNLVNETVKEFGRIDFLINNAGIAVRKPFIHMTEKEWTETIEINISSIFRLTKKVLPRMIEQNCGVIVNLSSSAGQNAIPQLAVYSSSKFSINGFTQALAKEVEKYRVKVYAVAPSGVNTELHRKSFPENNPTSLLKPEDVAKKVVKLCMLDCKTKTGSIISVRKGFF